MGEARRQSSDSFPSVPESPDIYLMNGRCLLGRRITFCLNFPYLSSIQRLSLLTFTMCTVSLVTRRTLAAIRSRTIDTDTITITRDTTFSAFIDIYIGQYSRSRRDYKFYDPQPHTHPSPSHFSLE